MPRKIRRFADPTYFPDLHRRQLVARLRRLMAERERRASPFEGFSRIRLSDKQEPPDRGWSEGSTDHNSVTGSRDGRFTQGA